MQSIKAKAKNKRTSGKFGKVKFHTKETINAIKPDLSHLRKPIDISVSRLCQVTKLLETGSDEVKAILSYECDIIYECRLCRTLFRSLVNFISHKRVFCQGKFNVTLNKDLLNNDNMMTSRGLCISPYISEQETIKENSKNDRILRSQVPREECKKDLTSIIDMLQRRRMENNEEIMLEQINENNDSTSTMINNEQIYVKFMDLNNFIQDQKLGESIDSVDETTDLIKTQIMELYDMLNRSTAILGPKGQFLKKQINEDDQQLSLKVSTNGEENLTLADTHSTKNLVCCICNARFSTKKTLTFHMKTLHTSHRMCYPCPCCTSTFVNTWSVYRHLFKVHRKSNEQVRKLRAQIQAKAFRKEITQVDEIEKETPTNDSVELMNLQGNNETQEWIDHLESDVDLQRCGGCGKRFDRKAALSSHLQHCQTRIAICNEVTNKVKKSSKVLLNTTMQNKNDTTKQNVHYKETMDSYDICTSISPDINETNETPIRVHDVSSLSKADWDMIESEHFSSDSKEHVPMTVLSNENVSQEQKLQSSNTQQELSLSSNRSDTPEIIYASDAIALKVGNKKKKITLGNLTKNVDYHPLGTNSVESNTNNSMLNTSPIQVKKPINETVAMENKMATIANLRKLQCLPCKRKFTSMTNLRRHMAIHIGWNRYRCKLCNFKCFVKCDCVAHCNKVHNAQNNRALITEMVVEIPQNQYTCNDNIVIDITNMEENTTESETTGSNKSSYDSKITDIEENEEHLDTHDNNVNTKDENNVIPIETITCLNNENDRINVEVDDENNEINVEVDNENNEINVEVDDEKDETNVEIDSENDKANVEVDSENNNTQNCEKGNIDCHSRMSNSDADLRKMVMEVIFGTPEEYSTKPLYSEQPTSGSVLNVKRKLQDDNENQISLQNEDSKDSISSILQDESKPQRPVRNRVKPVNKDFIYDLKEVAFRKDPSIVKGTCKTLSKKSFLRMRQNSEDSLEVPEQSLKNSKSLSNSDVPLVALENDNFGNKIDFKTKSVNLENTFRLS